ncbi:hypothetical protein SAMN04487996_114121 [Dyadobacter soli]|uniref:Uncharacterized protein n=1 Tax=Dyadobacter soli TaxID=659014 RepID=A0A1G7QQA9_9BACT|nr:hypothetical protein [Dyadobacter soli]SDG00727.1 hypothetical protein SAMN04487996_114121 [Dyadobacter soli]
MKHPIIASTMFLLACCHSPRQTEAPSGSAEPAAQLSRPSVLMYADIDPFIDVGNMTEQEVAGLFSKMHQADQQYRDSLYNGRKENEAAFSQKMRANDEANLKILNKIIQVHGWPKKSVFGEEAAETAWLVIWHHRGNRHILCQHFDLMEKAVNEGEMSASLFRQVEDQVAMLSPDQVNY